MSSWRYACSTVFGLIVRLVDDLLHRRQLIAGPKDPEPDRLPDLLHEL